jgi:hypothetical protein
MEVTPVTVSAAISWLASGRFPLLAKMCAAAPPHSLRRVHQAFVSTLIFAVFGANLIRIND